MAVTVRYHGDLDNKPETDFNSEFNSIHLVLGVFYGGFNERDGRHYELSQPLHIVRTSTSRQLGNGCGLE